jgi:rhamnulokinase
MSKHTFIAFDLGATSYRSIAGTLENGKVSTQEMTRFPNGMLQMFNNFHWDVFQIFESLKQSLATCAKAGLKPESVGIDTWGVDFGFLGEDGRVIGIPFAYRDPHTNTIMPEYFKLVPSEKVYGLTGIQFLQFNSLFQLYALKKNNVAVLNAAKDLLFMPDLLNYLFTGVKKAEFTIASTSQMLNPATMQFEKQLFDAMNVPMSLMQELVLPGTFLGPVTDGIAKETGIGKVPFVTVASHDTGSAIAAVPAEDEKFAYLSSGTWSLMGIETRKALISPETFKMNFTNEGGVEGTFRFLKNITGMWLLEQCKKEWEKSKDYSYSEITSMAQAEKPFRCFVDPDAPDFMNPENMVEAIQGYCKKTGQSVPGTVGELARCIFDSLAMKYRFVLDQLRSVSPHQINKLHVIGGGSKNALLCQFTANAIGIPVVAGPAEGTAYGNILVQAMAMGHVKSLAEIRQIVRNSVETTTYAPADVAAWEAAYRKFSEVTAK